MIERNKVVLMLGGNIGDTGDVFLKAIQLLQYHVGVITEISSVYKSEPWGNSEQQIFLNQAIILKTKLSAHQVLTHLLEIETELGRKRAERNGPRVIDIDILFYNDLIINELTLIIPHPRFHLRRFNLLPVVEIAPGWIHPVLNKTTRKLLEMCEDPLKVYIENQPH